MNRFLRRLGGAKESVRTEVWRARAAWRMSAWRGRAQQLRIEDPDEYARILALATEEGQRMVDIDPDGFVAFVLAESENPRSEDRDDGTG